VQAVYRNKLDIEATPEENGIDDEATLTVKLVGISFPEVVQDLLLLNLEMTEEMATRGANLDADGNLISWDLSYCPITALTECISGCVALTELDCEGCEQLTSLTYLNASNTAIEELPESIGGCTALQTLMLRDCTSLASLDDGIGNCKALQTLILTSCHSLASLDNGLVLQQLKSQGCIVRR